jgi:hypothetical protein
MRSVLRARTLSATKHRDQADLANRYIDLVGLAG